MPPLPKRKYAKTRQRLRRQHLKPPRGTIVRCPNCNNPALAHTVCYVCGRYHGRQVLELEGAGE